MDELDDEPLQSGGGAKVAKTKSTTKRTIQTIQTVKSTQSKLYNRLIFLGFKESILKKNKKAINDPIFEENYRDIDAVKILWRQRSNVLSLTSSAFEHVFRYVRMVLFMM